MKRLYKIGTRLKAITDIPFLDVSICPLEHIEEIKKEYQGIYQDSFICIPKDTILIYKGWITSTDSFYSRSYQFVKEGTDISYEFDEFIADIEEELLEELEILD